MEIVNTTQLEDYLTKTNLPFTSLQLLEGGSANFVWRLVDVSGMYDLCKLNSHSWKEMILSAGFPFLDFCLPIHTFTDSHSTSRLIRMTRQNNHHQACRAIRGGVRKPDALSCGPYGLRASGSDGPAGTH